MLHIILMILKFLGLLLLFLIGFILLCLFVILFVPLTYEADIEYEDKPGLCGKIGWLFGAIGFQAILKDGILRLYGKVLNFSVFEYPKENMKPDIPEPEDVFENEVFTDEEPIVQKECPKTDPVPVEKREMETKVEKVPLENEEKKRVSQKSESVRSDLPKKRLSKKSKQKSRLAQKLKDRWYSLKKKIQLLSEKKEQVTLFFAEECTQRSIKLGRKMLQSLLNHIKPKKLRGNFRFGLGKASLTGRVLGYLSMCYPLYGNEIEFYPDFEKTMFQGSFYIKGRVQLYMILFWGLRLILSKDIRRLIRKVKHMKG